MKTFEAGITASIYPYKPRWTGDTVEALTANEADRMFTDKGYYRNLVLREVTERPSVVGSEGIRVKHERRDTEVC